MVVPLSLNVTVPVAPAVTVAVKVTDCPRLLGLAEDVSEVVVAAVPIVPLITTEVAVCWGLALSETRIE